MRARVFSVCATAILGLLWQSTALGGLAASATLTPTQLGPTSYRYDITLHDTGSTPIGTFWFSWVPGADFMPTAPSNISSPEGWSAFSEGGGGSDGYSIQWTTPSPIAAGTSLSGFQFDSATTPSQMAGQSPFFRSSAVGTSFVYSGGPFSDGGSEFVATTVVPEPASLGGLAAAALLLLRRPR